MIAGELAAQSLGPMPQLLSIRDGVLGLVPDVARAVDPAVRGARARAREHS